MIKEHYSLDFILNNTAFSVQFLFLKTVYKKFKDIIIILLVPFDVLFLFLFSLKRLSIRDEHSCLLDLDNQQSVSIMGLLQILFLAAFVPFSDAHFDYNWTGKDTGVLLQINYCNIYCNII